MTDYSQVTDILQKFLGRDVESAMVACSSFSTPGSYKDIEGQARQSPFPDLPPELVIQIFRRIDSFSTAWALGKTSRQLEHIFILNSDAILRDVAFRSSQAQQLASAQELATLRQQSLSPHPLAAQNRTHRMLSAASSALRALSYYETCISNHFAQNDHEHLPRYKLTLAELIAFLRAYYCAMALVTLGQPQIPFKSLARLDMLEYLQMREVSMLLTPSRMWQDEIDLGIKFPEIYSRQSGCKDGFTSPFAPVTFPIDETLIPAVNWEETLLSLSCIEGCLLQNEACHDFHPGEPKPFWYFMLFDGYQKEASTTRRPKLGGLIRGMCGHHRTLSDCVDFADGPYEIA